MYSTSASTTKKQRPITAGYLARPKLGALRNLYPTKSLRPATGYGFEKRKKIRKSNDYKMDFRKRPDYADTAYREAVSRLRVLLADSYTPMKRPLRELDSAGEETDNQSLLSGASRTSRPSHIHYRYSPTIPKRYPYYSSTTARNNFTFTNSDGQKNILPSENKWESTHQTPTELMSFIDRQEDYIEQLEKESKLCRGELTTLLKKVKDVISENEDLHEKQKSSLIKSVFNRLETETETETETDQRKSTPKRTRRHMVLEGPTIVFESRISELEAHLTQTKIDLRKAIDENESFKRKISDGSLADGIGLDMHKKQVEALLREKNVLQDTVSKLQNALSQLRDKENSSCDQVKRSLDAAEQAQYEKNAAEHEIRRLKDELERQHGKIRDVISEQSRRISDERSAMERRYSQQIEQLTTDLGVQWESTNKIQLDLDKLRRENGDLRRELAQKQAYIDELRKEMQNIATMQSDMGVSGAEKSALEQQIASLQLANERTERQSRQEQTRLQAELQSLRQRLDRADADLIHSRRENIRLSEQIASLEKEINLNVALTDERSKRSGGSEIIALPPPKEDRENELSSMVKNMENKHAATVAELEGMIHSQNQLMDKLTGECHALTIKLEDASNRHKEEIRELQANLDYLSTRVNHSQTNNKLPSQYEDEEYNQSSTQRTAQHVSSTPLQATGHTRSPTNKPLSRTPSSASIKPITTPSRRRSSIAQNQPVTSTNQSYTNDPNNLQYSTDVTQAYSTEQYQAYAGAYDQQQYVDDGNLQYSTDPNQQYAYDIAADPQYMSQAEYDQYAQYSTDPNAQYATDPNAIYAPDQNITFANEPGNKDREYPGQYEPNQQQQEQKPADMVEKTQLEDDKQQRPSEPKQRSPDKQQETPSSSPINESKILESKK